MRRGVSDKAKQGIQRFLDSARNDKRSEMPARLCGGWF